jgi:hypothetical protein
MLGVDLTILLLIVVVLFVILLALDFVFAGGGMTSATMGGAAQCGAAMMGSPYGWVLIVAFIVIALGAFGFIFR